VLKRLSWQPGVNIELSPSANPQGWSQSNAIRWRYGMPESLLGFEALCPTPVQGVARAIHFWADLQSVQRFAIGTNTHLYLEEAGVLSDITPATGFVPGMASSGSTPFSLTVFSLDNFGQDLVACPSGQGIFIWVPPNGPTILMTEAPAQNNGLVVLDQIQIIFAWGCSPIGSNTGDPMLTRWCDQSDYTDWVASTTNQAGSFRLPHGSRIIGCLRVPGMLLLWTDIDLWSVQYIGFPLVFSFQNIGQLCSLIAQKAAAAMGQVVYWMSDHGFFSLTGGGPQQIVCPVWDIVYKNLDSANVDKILCGANFHYSEVWWFYPSLNGNTGEIDSYVKLNVQENEWDYGPAMPGVANVFSRTAWTDANQPGQPITIDLNGLMQQIDMGFTQNGGAAIPASIRAGYADIAEGDQLQSVDQFIPDFLWDGPPGVTPTLNVTLYFRAFPGDEPVTMGPFAITPTTEYVSLRTPRQIDIDGTTITAYPAVRAREVAIQIDSGELTPAWWRLGNCRLRQTPAGRIA
jgi:hypothetical protein